MKITRINSTSDNTCKCGSWLDHWKKFSRQAVPTHYPEKNCTENPEVGAHVQKHGTGDSNWYILPLAEQQKERNA